DLGRSASLPTFEPARARVLRSSSRAVMTLNERAWAAKETEFACERTVPLARHPASRMSQRELRALRVQS
ncbi:MAG TPA: hypothetical protein VFU02_14070, partial [Polyangiaceae bacterium]|nr:hypothetical protein [Polyangiaceae bacterium]